MKKKRIIMIAAAAILVIIAAMICFMIFGGSHTGIDNNPESKLSDGSNVLTAYFSWSGNGQQMARWISELAKGAKVLTEDVLSIPGRSVSSSEKEVKEWAAERLKENQ